jgi:predicted acetyltransferase
MPRLIAPSRDFEPSYRSYVAEMKANGEKLIPFPLTYPHDDFAELVATLEDNARGDGIPPEFVPHSTFWLVAGGEIVAVSNLRHSLTPALKWRGGHVGYSVRPSSRRRGYGSLILRLTLQEARKLGIRTALVTCAKDNVGSAMVIRANGGVLQSEEFLAEYEEILQRYHVPVLH